MTGDLVGAVTQAFGVVGLLVLVAFLLFREQRHDQRRVRANDLEVEKQADAHVLALLKEHREERGELRRELNDLRERIAVMEAEKRQHADVLQVHAAWDYALIEQVRRLDPRLSTPPAPPLYPPHPWPDREDV